MAGEVTREQPRAARWLLGGGLLGAFAPVGLSLLEAVPRYLHKARGGGGESSDWGEPLFYGVLFMVPGALVGALVGVVGWGVVLAMRRDAEEEKKKKNGPPPGPP